MPSPSRPEFPRTSPPRTMARVTGAAMACTLAALLSGCVAPTGPVEVTRFHLESPPVPLGRGTIAILAAPGGDGASLEFGTFASALGRELQRVGYTLVPASGGARAPQQVAELAIARQTYRPERNRSPVSVGVGGGTGGYGGGGVGVGVGIDLSGPPPEQVETAMRVTIRQRPGGPSLWEGSAGFTVRATAPTAQTALGAARAAAALFKDFPGRSGETIYVP